MSWPRPPWEQRFRAGRVLFPRWAADDPDHAVVVMTDDERLQVHSWTPSTGVTIPTTGRRHGTRLCQIDPGGRWVWWFDDTDGNEHGVWRRQPFNARPGWRVETPIDLPAAYPHGLLINSDGTAVIGRGTDRGTQIHSVPVGRSSAGTDGPTLIYASPGWAWARSLSRDGQLIAVEHSEHGDSRHPSIRVFRRDGWPVADLDDGGARGLWALGFSPIHGDQRLLVRHERGSSPRLLIWDVARLIQRPVELGVEGEIADATWYPDGRHLLVTVDHEARTRAWRVDLYSGSVVGVGPREGTVEDAVPRPDGDAWLLHSSAAKPPAVISARSGRVLLSAPGPDAPPSVPVSDVWVDGPAGRIHALLRVPAGASAPYRTVVKVHGGPTMHDSDVFSPMAAAWVDAGWAVLEVNYRGSTGYGVGWRDALEEKVGFTELADVAAVHDHLIAQGTVDAERSVLVGRSWGGYLTLLGLGTQPDRWAAGVAGVPIADYVAAYEDETGALQEFDKALFGGSPDEVPERYRESSPLTYIDQVRAPVLISAGENDPRCPYRQILTYVEALRARGGTVETHVYDAGHSSMVDDERVTQMRLELDFVRRHL